MLLSFFMVVINFTEFCTEPVPMDLWSQHLLLGNWM